MVNGGALKNRSTSDLVVIFLAGLVGLYILGSMIFVIVVTVTGHDENLGLLLNRLGSIVNSIVGAVIGFVGGRGMGSSEGYQPRPRRSTATDTPSCRRRNSRRRAANVVAMGLHTVTVTGSFQRNGLPYPGKLIFIPDRLWVEDGEIRWATPGPDRLDR